MKWINASIFSEWMNLVKIKRFNKATNQSKLPESMTTDNRIFSCDFTVYGRLRWDMKQSTPKMFSRLTLNKVTRTGDVNIAFERIFYLLLFWTSSHHKVCLCDPYIQKERKKSLGGTLTKSKAWGEMRSIFDHST